MHTVYLHCKHRAAFGVLCGHNNRAQVGSRHTSKIGCSKGAE